MNPKQPVWAIAVTVSLLVNQTELLAHKRCCPPPCCPTPVAPAKPTEPTTPAAPSTEPAQPQAPPDIDFDTASSADVAGDAQGMAPNMIGDALGSGAIIFPVVGFPVSVAGGGRVQKIGENGSPMPRDRAYYIYNHFHNAYDLGVGTFDVNRHTFGYERTMLDRIASFELRMPFSSTLASTQTAAGTPVEDTEFGNVWIGLKSLVFRDDMLAIGAGVGIDTPTADNTVDLTTATVVTNETVTLSPWFGGLLTPNPRSFSQAFVQFDTPVTGSSVSIGGVDFGTFDDQDRLHLDASTGYWIFRNSGSGGITGIAPITELHYTTTLNNTDIAGTVVSGANRRDFLNATLGVTFEVADQSAITFAGVAPLGDSAGNREFDAEFTVRFNYYFGARR